MATKPRLQFTLFLASVRDNKVNFDHPMTYAYVLVDPEGLEVRGHETVAGEPLPKTAGDIHYIALADCIPHVPEGSHLRILTVEQYLYEAEAYTGVFNGRPEDRIRDRYRKGKKLKGTYANAPQLQAVDALLVERRITTSGERPSSLEDDNRFRRVANRAKELMGFDPDAPGGY